MKNSTKNTALVCVVATILLLASSINLKHNPSYSSPKVNYQKHINGFNDTSHFKQVNKPSVKPSVKNSTVSKSIKSNFSNVIFIGDSITFGFTKADNTPVQKGNVYAKIGAHAYEGKLLLGNNKSLIESRAGSLIDYVFIMYGANDYGYEPSIYKHWYEDLISHVKKMFPNAKIVLQSVMPMRNTPSQPHRSQEPNRLNKIVREIASEENVQYLDVADNISNLDSLHVADGLHFQKEMYPLWIKVIKNNFKVES